MRDVFAFPAKVVKRYFTNKRFEAQDKKAGAQLRNVLNRLDAIRPKDILLFCCLRNEQFRMPFFARYYRNLGVKHFLVVDNGSTDSFVEWAGRQPDFSVWHTTASYRDSAFGMLWLNDLLRRHGTGHWCVVADPDEFLVYPYKETRSLAALAEFLEQERRHCLHTVLLDAYSDKTLAETVLREGQDPFALCPFFDRDGYIQREGWRGGTWIQGGPRLRMYMPQTPDVAPALNKVPFVKWRANFHYRHSTHDFSWPLFLNRAHTPGTVSPTGALFHFKMIASLTAKAREEMPRGEHYAGGREYRAYLSKEDISCYEPGLSVRYEDSEQLVGLGLMSLGRWF